MKMKHEARAVALHRLRYAVFFLGQFANSAKKTFATARKAINAARIVAENSLQSLIGILEGGTLFDDVDAMDIAFGTAITQARLMQGLVKLEWDDKFQQANTIRLTQAILVRTLNEPYSFDIAEEIIVTSLEENGRLLTLIARTNAAVELMTESATLLGLEATRVTGQQIRREIRFSPEFRQTGLSILSYFSEIIATKYPGLEVGVTIEQRADRVILTIDTPDGQRETIEKELSTYGLVVTGQIKPQDYLQNRTEVLKLQHKLEIAALESRQTRELLHSERHQYEGRIKSLEEQTAFLRDALSGDRDLVNQLVEGIKELSLSSARSTSHHLERILSLLEKGGRNPDQNALVEEIKEVKASDPSAFEKLHEMLVKGAFEGAAGNYLYALLQALSRFG